MSALAIIPARGGSKRLPRKNVRLFLGKPIIAYPIQVALQSNLFAEVMVSTDDEEIARIAQEYGATVPFFRSPETANDYAGISEVLVEVIQCYAAKARHFDTVCCLLPTAPLITQGDLSAALEKLNAGGYDSVFPVSRFQYPIWRSLKMEGDRVLMNWPENYHKRSQDLPPAFHDCGQFYWVQTDRFLAARRVFTENSGAIELPGIRVQDIDTEDDWRLCELKYQFLHSDSIRG
jgi:N-acylneuraminate cytidylyltransferase